MRANWKLRQKVLFAVGTVSAILSLPFRDAPLLGGLLVAVSAACYLLLPWTAFFRPAEEYTWGVFYGFIAFFVYAFCMLSWGRDMASEGEDDDWREFLLFGIVALDAIVPFLRGFARQKRIAQPCAAPNGGFAAQRDNLQVNKGPPSVK